MLEDRLAIEYIKQTLTGLVCGEWCYNRRNDNHLYFYNRRNSDLTLTVPFIVTDKWLLFDATESRYTMVDFQDHNAVKELLLRVIRIQCITSIA